jgi:hypothetical protein
MSDPRRIVAYSDLLGFSTLVVKSPGIARDLLSAFYNSAQSIKVRNAYEDLELFLFSDFLYVQGDRVTDVVNYMCELYREALQYSEHGPAAMLIRGGIARGGVLTQERREAPKVTKNFVVSPALTHAVKMESVVKGQRLLISAKEREKLDHFWNTDIHAITYDQPSLKPSSLFEKYRYKDLLWARDLSVAPEESRTHTMRYIEIAKKLFLKNVDETAAVQIHYSETLRICLLSYSSLLEPCAADRDFVSTFVDQVLIPHPNSTVWLGFLECVLLSKDAFAFHAESSLADFFKYAALTKCWGEVSTALERPEHAQLKGATQEFVNSVIPTFPEPGSR